MKKADSSKCCVCITKMTELQKRSEHVLYPLFLSDSFIFWCQSCGTKWLKSDLVELKEWITIMDHKKRKH